MAHTLLPKAAGWYGKLPSRGDFVGRGLPRPWQRHWDDWLQRGLAAATEHLGPSTMRQRLQAMPTWQWVACPHQAGEPWWCGVLGPSSDRVGRAFPLLLAEAYDEQALAGAALGALRARTRAMALWLHAARTLIAPKELDTGLATLAATAWGGDPDRANAEAEDRNDTVGSLVRRWPAAASFWWPADLQAGLNGTTVAAPQPPLAEAWLPRDDLMLDLLCTGR
jgi:type VI secretion system protein ImpM